jgi:hypothetical protein
MRIILVSFLCHLDLAGPNLSHAFGARAILLQRQTRSTKGLGNQNTAIDSLFEKRIAAILHAARLQLAALLICMITNIIQKNAGVTTHLFSLSKRRRDFRPAVGRGHLVYVQERGRDGEPFTLHHSVYVRERELKRKFQVRNFRRCP